MLTRLRRSALSVWRLAAPADRRGLRNVELGLVVLFGTQAVLQVLLDGDDLERRWLSLAAFSVWLPTPFVPQSASSTRSRSRRRAASASSR